MSKEIFGYSNAAAGVWPKPSVSHKNFKIAPIHKHTQGTKTEYFGVFVLEVFRYGTEDDFLLKGFSSNFNSAPGVWQKPSVFYLKLKIGPIHAARTSPKFNLRTPNFFLGLQGKNI